MELLRALAVLAELPREETPALAGLLGLERPPTRAEYTELFVLQLVPHASVYLGAEGMLGGEVVDRIQGFWRALGREPPPDPDHLTTLLGLYVELREREGAEPTPQRRAALARARAALLFEHLVSWQPAYLAKATEIGPPPYRAWATLLRSALAAEVARTEVPNLLPVHLRAAPLISESDQATLDDLVAALLAPVRCGLILTRADLQRAAQDLGLGVRAGGRRFVLHTLLEHRAPATMEWLGVEAAHWAERHMEDAPLVGTCARFWARRAERTTTVLAQWQRTARGHALDGISGQSSEDGIA